MAPWQQDFFTWSVGNAYAMGFSSAKNFLMFLSKYQTGRLTDPNYCWIEAAAYTNNIRASSTSPYYTNFHDIYMSSVDPAVSSLPCASPQMAAQLKLKVGEMTGYSSATAGFPSNMQPSVALLVDAGAPNAAEAWTQFNANSVKPDYNQSPVWDIVPFQQ